jgi:putative transposase
MECVGCGSTVVSERGERNAQGYRRFRCRACVKQVNERSAGILNRTQYPSDVIALVVLWGSVRSGLSRQNGRNEQYAE